MDSYAIYGTDEKQKEVISGSDAPDNDWGAIELLNPKTPREIKYNIYSPSTNVRGEGTWDYGGGGTDAVAERLWGIPAATAGAPTAAETVGAIPRPEKKQILSGAEEPPTKPSAGNGSNNWSGTDQGGTRGTYRIGSALTKTNPLVNAYLKTFDPAAIPTYNAPEYNAPTYDEAKVRKYSQEISSPYLSKLQNALRGAITRAFATPSIAARKYELGDVFEKYGEGVASTMQGAIEQGRKTYNDEYSRAIDEAKTQYTGATHAANQNFIAAMNKYQAAYQAALKEYYS